MALSMAADRQFPDGIRGQGVNLMSDNWSQPVSAGFMEACAAMGTKPAFTSYKNGHGTDVLDDDGRVNLAERMAEFARAGEEVGKLD